MIVCHCHVVSDRAVRAVVNAGANDLDSVVSACGAGDACGGCLPSIERLLADAEVAVRDPQLLVASQAHRRGARAQPVLEPVAV